MITKYQVTASLTKPTCSKIFARILSLSVLAIIILLAGLFVASPKAHAATGSNTIPPPPCLTVTVVVDNVRIVPLPLGSGTAYDILMAVENDCNATLNAGGGWSLVGKLNCYGETGLGITLSGNLPKLQIGQSQTVVDQSRVSYCATYENGVLVKQSPVTNETFYGQANGTLTTGIAVRGLGQTSLY